MILRIIFYIKLNIGCELLCYLIQKVVTHHLFLVYIIFGLENTLIF